MINDKSFNDFDFYLKGIVDEKSTIRKIHEKKQQLIVLIKNCRWQDLKVEPNPPNGSNTKSYVVGFKDDIAQKVSEIENSYNSLNHLNRVGHEILFEGDELSMNCTIQISKLDNRIDICNDGIPRSIRKLGLGCKIYRAILEFEDFITSRDSQLSDFGKILWNSLRRNIMFYTFYTEYHAYCFASDKSSSEIIRTLEKELATEQGNVLWDEDFLKINKREIEQSSLKSLL